MVGTTLGYVSVTQETILWESACFVFSPCAPQLQLLTLVVLGLMVRFGFWKESEECDACYPCSPLDPPPNQATALEWEGERTVKPSTK